MFKHLSSNILANCVAMYIYVTQHVKINSTYVRMYIHMLKFDHFWILTLNNSVHNNKSLIKFTPFMQHFIGNLMQFTDL